MSGRRARASLLALAVVVLLGFGVARSGGAATGSTGLVAAYSFDEGQGTVVHDASGNGNDGTVEHATWTAGGRHKDALAFNGTNADVRVPDSASLDLTQAMTEEAWVRPAALSGWQAVLVKEQSSDLVYGLYASSASAGPAGVVYAGGEKTAYGTSQLPVRRWSFLAATYDGSGVTFYLNGIAVGHAAATGAMPVANGALRIGGDSIWGEWFNGAIDDVRLYNRALSVTEIAADESAPVTTTSKPVVDTTPPSAPAKLAATSVTSSSVSLSWSASSDNVGVTGYGVYRNSTSVGTTASTSYTVSGLSCGTSYALSVDAFDAAGNTSGKSTVTVATAACGDTQAPTVPGALHAASSTQTSVSLAWTASSDNVGVTAYGVYQGASSVGTTATTSDTVSGLSCGTSYSFSVDAVDAAGNRSGKATVSVSTTACSGGGTSGGSGSANLWVDTNGGSCARSTSLVAYTDASACASFAAAWSAAQCGDTIGVAGGSYGSQRVSTAKSCSSSTPVTFAASKAVTLTGPLDVAASYVSFSGPFSFTQTYNIDQGVSYVTLDGVSTPHAYILGSHVTIKGGQVGPNNTCSTGWEDGLQIWDNGSYSATYVTVDGVTFHDVSDNGNQCAGHANSGVHVDCIQILGASNITIENSTFYNCATSGIMARPYTTPMHDVLVQNNMFGKIVTPGASINIGNSADTCNNVVVQYNTAMGASPVVTCGVSGSSGNVIRGNIFATLYSCGANFTCSHNVTTSSSPVGTGSKECSPVFASPGSTTANYHLAATDTCAKNAGDPSSYPSTDYDGDKRPQGSGPDIGADEVG